MTQFDERTVAEPIPDAAGAGRPRGPHGWAARGVAGPPAKRARLDPRAGWALLNLPYSAYAEVPGHHVTQGPCST